MVPAILPALAKVWCISSSRLKHYFLFLLIKDIHHTQRPSGSAFLQQMDRTKYDINTRCAYVYRTSILYMSIIKYEYVRVINTSKYYVLYKYFYYIRLCHLYPTPSRNSFVFSSFSIFFRSSYFSGGVFFWCALVPGMLALDLPTSNLQRLVLLCLTVTTESVSLQDEESGRTLEVLLMSLGRKHGLM